MKRFSTVIDVNSDLIDDILGELNEKLATNILAQLVVKFAHWNVKGDGFFPTHKLFDKIYEEVVEAVDRIGERITALGGIAQGMPEQAINLSRLPGYGADAMDTVQAHIQAMTDLMGFLANDLRSFARSELLMKNDLVTQNMILDIVEGYDKHIYFLEGALR